MTSRSAGTFTLVSLAALLGLTAGPVSAQFGGELEAALREAERSAAQSRTQRARAETELESLTERRGELEGRLRGRVRALYRLRRAGALPLAGGFDALLRHQSRVERLERMVEHDAESLSSLDRRRRALDRDRERLRAAAEDAERQARALEGRVASAAREQHVAEVAAAAFTSLDESVPSVERFDAQMGELALPLVGTARITDAEREGGPGLAFEAPSGAAVRAVASGRVAYADPHPAYGRLVIIDHGGGHYSVYGGLGEITVRAGDVVTREATIARTSGQPLFFQVRRGTRPVDARRWLGL